MGIFQKFMPKSVKFYPLLSEITTNILKASDMLEELMSKWDKFGDYSTNIHLIEHKCDELTHAIIHELNETFITPIDREDIYALVNSLDNIVDCIDVIASRIHLYKVKNQIEYAPQFCSILNQQMKLIADVIDKFKDSENVMEKLIAVRDYETQGDNVFREAISSLFESEKDVFELIKKKEILELMEKAVDRCQTVTIVIEGIIIKNA